MKTQTLKQLKDPCNWLLLGLTCAVIAIAGLLFGCDAQVGIPPTTTPTEARSPKVEPVKLRTRDLRNARRTDCEQRWVTGDPHKDVARAWRELRRRKIRVTYRLDNGPAIALAGTLSLPRGAKREPDQALARVLTHELVHYCRRTREGGLLWQYPDPRGRWAYEVEGYRQSIRTGLRQGHGQQWKRNRSREVVRSLRRNYGDVRRIDRRQLQRETVRALEEVR